MNAYIVMDIGGTSFRTGIYTEKGELLHLTITPSDNFLEDKNRSIEDLREMFVNRVLSIVNSIKSSCEYEIKGLGIAFPGPVHQDGVISSATTLWGPTEQRYSLQSKLQELLSDIRIEVLNDVTSAGWRYQDEIKDNFCIITVSSGIGNKVFWEKEVLLGKDNIGGEIGHFYHGGKYKDVICDCGKSGHIGAISSGRGVEKLAHILKAERPLLYNQSLLYGKETLSTYDIVYGVKHQDSFALMVLEESIKPLAKACSFMYYSIGIEKFVIMGGFAIAVGYQYTDLLKKHVLEYQTFSFGNDSSPDIILGKPDDYHGLIGMGKYLSLRTKN